MNLHPLSVTLASLVLATSALAQEVTVAESWARATVPGQKATGAFMKITAKQPSKLVAASTPVAGITEIHEMKMDKDVMRMSAVAALDLPAGKTVELKPGGYHVMLMELKQALPKGSTVPLTLTLRDAKGQESKVELKLPVAATAPSASCSWSMTASTIASRTSYGGSES